ncbi:fimbrial protein [Klebsiella oxytoca]|nr:type 1 fimbrial protein [Klebsiella oxytoca]
MAVNFRKSLASTLVVFALASVSDAALADTVPVDLSVTFTGEIRNNTCGTATVSGGGVVPFGDISQASFGGSAGTVGATRTFTVSFENCGDATSGVNMWIDAANSDTALNAVNNDSGGSMSQNVAVQVWSDAQQLELGSGATPPSSPVTHVLTSAAEDITLTAKVVQTAATLPTPGSLNATGTLYVQYQ